MTLKNPALRDWPALRLQDTNAHPHPRRGDWFDLHGVALAGLPKRR